MDQELKKITTYNKVCKALNEEPLKLSQFSFLHKNDRKSALNKAKITQLERLFNSKDWIPNFNDSNQYKYYPVFWNQNGQLVFHVSHCLCVDYFVSEVAFYETKEISDHIGKYFSDLYIGIIKTK